LSRTFWRGELPACASVYFFLALTNLVLKLRAAGGWLSGELDDNQRRLLEFAYYNNEQSRLLQFLIPEFLVRCFGLSVPNAYMVQRLVFVWLAFVLFHVYQRRWFRGGLAFAGVTLLAAILPLTYLWDLQESAPLLMVTFLWGLWAIRDDRPIQFAVALFVGALNNETTLALAAAYFFYNLRGWQPRPLWTVTWRTLAVSAPAYLVTGIIRYINLDRPHLGGAWHLPDNLYYIGLHFLFPTLDYDYFHHNYLAIFVLFGTLWIYAYLRWAQKPPFLRAALLMVPLFILAHLLTGIISEVRQMVPLAYIIIPASFFWLFPDEMPGEEEKGETKMSGDFMSLKSEKGS
jgi:hypothetical protein